MAYAIQFINSFCCIRPNWFRPAWWIFRVPGVFEVCALNLSQHPVESIIKINYEPQTQACLEYQAWIYEAAFLNKTVFLTLKEWLF